MSVPSTIDHTSKKHSPQLAYWMVRAADLAYKDEATIDAQARAWGFGRVRHHHTRFTPPFPLEDTQAYTIASDKMIITGFRGTEPAQIRDWLSDATTPPWPGPGKTGYIHYGFGQALDSVFPAVRDALADFRDNEQSVWFTGHSLGGALAAMELLLSCSVGRWDLLVIPPETEPSAVVRLMAAAAIPGSVLAAGVLMADVLMIGVAMRWIHVPNARDNARIENYCFSDPCRGLPTRRTTLVVEPATRVPTRLGTRQHPGDGHPQSGTWKPRGRSHT
ncbi:lipase family protein [Streptomyces lavendulae]|uniref:lipase family protein n=1 Tax=Streptomyces lavendulae TaxID=1914 RepID=UPI00367FFBCB